MVEIKCRSEVRFCLGSRGVQLPTLGVIGKENFTKVLVLADNDTPEKDDLWKLLQKGRLHHIVIEIPVTEKDVSVIEHESYYVGLVKEHIPNQGYVQGHLFVKW